MTTSINFNQSPYFDDFSALKQYHRVLFNPGMPVQARELTQLQTILQTQIELFGKHVFANGSLVIPGESTYYNIAYAKVFDFVMKDSNLQTDTYLSLDELASDPYIQVCGAKSGCIAEIIEVIPENSGTLERTLYYRPVTGNIDLAMVGNVYTQFDRVYVSSVIFDKVIVGGLVYVLSGVNIVLTTVIDKLYDSSRAEYYVALKEELPFDNKTTKVVFGFRLASMFLPGETLYILSELSQSYNSVPNKVISLKTGSDAIGFGLKARLNSGVFFANGFFLTTPELECFVDYYTTKANKSVGLNILEMIIDSNEDASLNDPSNSLINYNAPGADRLAIKTELVAISLETAAQIVQNNSEYVSYIEVLQFVDGQLEHQLDRTIYGELAKEFAHRTYDESGSYWVSPFITKARELDATRISLEIHPGKAYVYGYEVETILTKRLPAIKPTQTLKVNNDSFHYKFTNLLYVNILKGIPTLHKEYTLSIKDDDSNIIDEFVNDDDTETGHLIGYEGTDVNRVIIGTARVYTVVKFLNYYVLGLYDLKLVPGAKINKTVNIFDSQFSAEAKENSVFGFYREDIAPQFLIEIPNTQVKTFYPFMSTNQMEYNVLRTLKQKLIVGNTIANVINSHEAYESAYGCLIVDANTHEAIPFTTVEVDGNSLIVYSTQNLDYRLVDINFVVHKNNVKEKPKTLTTINNEIVHLVGGTGSLANTDIFKIIEINGKSDPEYLNLFFVHNGQYDCFYSTAYISTKIPELSVDSDIKVTYSFFTHGLGDYFSVDSYVRKENIVNNLTYDEIPVYTNSQGKTLRLGNCLDFRPVLSNIIQDQDFILNEGYFQYDLEYYVSRIDKLWVSAKGTFGITEGVASLKPTEPLDLDNTMSIYVIKWPKYTYSVDEVVLKMIDNRNYTMRDIAKLDQRVSNLEKYTTLSLLEKNSLDLQILDSQGFSRYKSGLIVDNFTTIDTMLLETIQNDKVNTESMVSIDTKNRILRPAYHKKALQFKLKNQFESLHNNLLTLNYNSVMMLSQTSASHDIVVNPYMSFIVEGDMKLYPSADFWRDEKSVNVVLKANSDILHTLVSLSKLGVFNTLWNDWQIEWSGIGTTKNISQKISGNPLNTSGTSSTSLADLSSSTSQPATTYDILSKSSSEALPININYNTNLVTHGNKSVDLNDQLFIRSIPVTIKVRGLRALTRLYVFFDSVDVTEYCGSLVMTDANGSVDVVLTIPSQRFLVGDRLIEIKDSVDSKPLTCYACAVFSAKGCRSSAQEQLMLTRTPNITSKFVYDEKNLSSPEANVILNQISQEPVGQSFYVPGLMSHGAFVTKIDLFFKTKSTTQPVIIELRSMTTSGPDKRVLASAIVSAEQVNVSSTSIVPTTFTFDAPVYLKPGQGYCFVIITNNPQYTVWVAKTSESDVYTHKSINSSTAPGSLYKTQNSATWIADTETNIKYNLYACKFNPVSGTYYFAAKTTDLTQPLMTNCFQLTNNSKEVIIFSANHNLIKGDMFALSRSDYIANNDTMSQYCMSIFKTYINFAIPNTDDLSHIKVSRVINNDIVCFDFTTPYTVNDANFSLFGDSHWLMSTNARANVLGTYFDEIEYPGTSISHKFFGVTSARLGSLYQTDVTNHENLELPQAVWFLNDEATSEFNSWYEVTLTTTDPYVSPVIDLEKSYCVPVSNRINNSPLVNKMSILSGAYQTSILNASVFTHMTADDFSESRYITKEIKLINPALGLKIMFAANKPSGTSIEVYYRVFTAMETIDSNKPWYKAFNKDFININYKTKTSTDTVKDVNVPNPHTKTDQYLDMYYETLVFDEELAVGVNKTVDPDELYPFNSFQIKLVLKSENDCIVPTLKDFRVIAVV